MFLTGLSGSAIEGRLKMPNSRDHNPDFPQKTAELLIEATLNAWESGGTAAISARSLCGATGVQVSSLYHHFGSLEQLLVTAQERAIDVARVWCTQQIESLGNAIPPHGIGALLAGLIDDWSRDQRRIAFAWRECRLNAIKLPAFILLADRWKQVWDDFWATVCSRMSIPQHGAITARFFTGESGYQLIPWNRQADRAALGETCAGWGEWLAGRLSPPAPWREWARARAATELVSPPLRDEIEARIAAAAAAVVERQGVAGLTYRAVAKDAGVTLGVVSHKFRTGADLVAAAFEDLYRRAADASPGELANLPASSREALARDLAEKILPDARGSMGSDELLLACARDPSLRTFAGQLRYTRGRTSGHYLDAMVGASRTIEHVDAAIFSSFLVGLINAYGLVEERDARIAGAEAELAHLIATLAAG
jgi:AcrR family transcriptional regulator